VGVAPLAWRAASFSTTAAAAHEGLVTEVAEQRLACDAGSCATDPRCTRHCRGRRIRDYAPIAAVQIYEPSDRWNVAWEKSSCPVVCRTEGRCQSRDGECFAETDGDCLRSEVCVRDGRCFAVDG